jgi:hypothetical protein
MRPERTFVASNSEQVLGCELLREVEARGRSQEDEGGHLMDVNASVVPSFVRNKSPSKPSVSRNQRIISCAMILAFPVAAPKCSHA